MSDHEFEKQVQERMGELKFNPSEVLWPQVQKRVRQARRRRRIILWVPLMLLLIGGVAGYVTFFNHSQNRETVKDLRPQENPTKNSNQSDNNSTLPTNSEPSENSQNNTATVEPGGNQPKNYNPTPVSPNNPVTSSKDATTAPSAKKDQQVPDRIVPKADDQVSENKGNKTQLQPDRNRGSRKPVTDPAGQNDPKQQDVLVNQKEAPKNNKPGNVSDKGNIPSQQSQQDKAGQTVPPVPPDSALTQQNIPARNPQPAPVLTNKTADNSKATAMLPPAKPKKQHGSNWRFGVQGHVGGSHISRSGLFDLLSNENKVVEDLASNLPVYQQTPSPTAIPPSSNPSTIWTGKSFSIGGFAEKPLTKRLSLSAGLQYHFYSVRTKVGTFETNTRLVNVNSSMAGSQFVSNYYRGNSNATLVYWGGFDLQDYTNRYHFIELPVTLHTQLNKGKVLPIIWDAGVAVSYLVKTNALHYDGNNDVYYKDMDLFNPVQFTLSSSVNVELFSKKKHPLVVGPRINYQLSNLLDKDVSTGQHLWSFGLNMRMYLKK